MSEAALMSCAQASDLEATAEEEEELVSGSEDESGGKNVAQEHPSIQLR